MKFPVETSLILITFLFSLKSYEALLENIKIGAIFHEGDENLIAAFDEALKDLNNEPNAFFNLKAVKKVNIEKEGFKTATVACELLQEGVAAIFGPAHRETRNIVSSIAARFDVPHLEYSYRRRDDGLKSKSSTILSSINVYPNSRFYEKAIAEMVNHMKWHAFTFVYQTKDALTRFQEYLQHTGRRQYSVTIKELKPLSEIKLLKTEKERDVVYEKLVKEIKSSSHYSVLLDIEHENLPKMLDTMKSMEFVTDYFMCFIVNLDASLLEIGQFIDRDSIANVTRFQFIRDVTKKISVEEALLYDSVYAFHETLTNLYKEINSDQNSKIIPVPLTCDGQAKYEMGLRITKLFLKKIKSGKKTGVMSFNAEGGREFELDVINNQAGKLEVVGEFKNNSLKVNDTSKFNSNMIEALKSKIFKVVTREGAPYIMPVEDDPKGIARGRYIGGKKYEGYCIDLIEKIENHAKIKCEFELVPDNEYGTIDPKTRQWTGLIKQLLDLKADFAICDLTITSERQSAVDFTAPFMNLGITILFSKPKNVQPDLFSFMDPLSTEVWMYMATAFLIVSLMILFQSRFTPGEWINPHLCDPNPQELENSFTLMNSLWLTMGSLMQQGSDILPRTLSVRIAAGIWWFFILIIVSSYTANLAAFLTAVKMEDQIDSVEDLAKQTKISYGSIQKGSTNSFFKNSNNSLYQRMYIAMSDQKPSVFTSSNQEGVERVLKGKRKYAFFMESTSIEYQIARHCELQKVGPLLDNKGYGIATPPNSPFRTVMSEAILHLQEKGELYELKRKWWEVNNTCSDEYQEPTNSNELMMSHVGGVFLVLIIGCSISTFISIMEFLWNVRKVAIEEKISQWEAFVKEATFFFNIKLKTKPVSTSNSSNSVSLNRNNFDKSDSMDDSTTSSLHRLGIQDTSNVSKINKLI